MRSYLLIACLLFSVLQGFAKGKITGRITDEKNGETVIGAVVIVKGTTLGATTDVDGNFTIPAVEKGVYELEIKYVGYQTKVIEGITVYDDKDAIVTIAMAAPKSSELNEVVVRTSLKKENIGAMIAFQKNTNTVAQVVSAEAIRKSPDRNAGDVLKRVSSASVQDGKYLVIRGLADRYNQAMLNGSLLSSTEPDRKTFSFDLFPAGMIENIVINKAATPDLPGEFAGGLIQVNTKDIPTKNFFTVQLGGGSNSQTFGKDFNYYKGGKYDFLGIDDGTRALPSSFPDKDGFRALSDEKKFQLSKEFKNDWAYDKKSAPINANVQAYGGFNSMLFKKKIGGMFAVNYNKQNRIIDQTRAFYNQSGATQTTLDFKEQSFNEEVLWGALANLTVELNSNNKISFKNLYNVNGVDNTLIRTGRNNDYGADVRSYQLGFKSTQFVTSQLSGSHFLPEAKIKINWNGNIVRLHQDQPNLRRMEYRKSDGDSIYYASVQGYLPSLSSASRFYSTLTDRIVAGNTDASRQFKMFGQAQTIKIGYMMQRKTREFNSRPIGMVGGTQEQAALPNDQIFAAENLSAGSDGFRVGELSDKDYDYSANSMLNAGFLMFDNTFAKNIRIVWGARYENYNQQLNGFRSNKAVNLNSTVGDILPSLNFTYKPNEKTNYRFCASKTVIRPEFRELSPFTFYDFELLAAVQGNPDLKRTNITNLDLRYELYPRSGELVTFGVFYKNFKNVIEQFYNESGVNTFSFTYGNAPSATSYGAEFEFRKRLDFTGVEALSQFTAFANASYIFNNVGFNIKDAAGNDVKNDRPMQGQSPYVINSGLQYETQESGTSATVLFNMIGKRIFLVGNEQNPNIWEAPRPLLDFQVSQKVFKRNGEFKLTLSDIMNKKANFYQDKNDNGKYDVSSDFLRMSRRYGTNVTLSFLYNFK